MLDSLRSRAEWEQSYRVLYTQYLLAKNHANDLDSTAVTTNQHCDSLVKEGFRKERDLIEDNASVQRELNEERDSCRGAKIERWVWRGLGAAAILLAVLMK